jgi:outer membrane protein assembly factor BamA
VGVTLAPYHRKRRGAARHPGRLFAAVAAPSLLAAAVSGCTAKSAPPACSRPDLGGCAIEEVSFEGTRVISSSELAERIATAESSHFLGGVLESVPLLSIWDALTVEYERFDRFVLERDMARIERFYRARGFYGVQVRAARVQRAGGPGKEGRVHVQIVVSEGEPVKVASVELFWKDWKLDTAKGVTRPVTDAKNKLKVGARFEEDQYEETKKAMLRAITDRGFAYGAVEGHVDVDVMKHEARVKYTIELGPESTFGKIKLKGLGELPEAPLRAALNIEEGDRYSTEALDDAEQALADFGVFGAINVKPELAPPGQPKNPRVPVTFTVQPAALRAVKLGGGAELGARAEAHLVAGWEDRNFLGGLRRFSIEAKPGLTFYPTSLATLFSEAPTRILPELQLRSELRQPGAFERRTTAVLRGAFKIYRLEIDTPAGEPIIGYQEYAGSTGLERPFLKSKLNASLLLNLQLNNPFVYNDDEADLSEGLEQVLIPSVQTIVSYDLRRDRAGKPDRINPTRGIYLAADTQVAGYVFGSANDFRFQPEFRGYLPISRRLTLGFRLLTGFLFPTNYGCSFLARDATSDPAPGCENTFARDVQLLQFRGFFSGGPNSNRGYGYNDVGPHAELAENRSVPGVQAKGLVPTGGMSLWESSVELRMRVVGEFGTVIFVDGSDVARDKTTFRLARPHLSAGLGLRYNTPVGPLRLDLGYRIPCAQVFGVCDEAELVTKGEGDPADLLGLPLSVNVAIGQAF